MTRLYFPSNKEVQAEVKNSVRKNGSTCSLTKVPQNRYLTTKNNNQMSLKPSSVEFKSNTNLQLGILLEDPMGAKFYSHKNIKFDAVDDIRFYTKKNINIIALVSIRIYVPSSKQSLVIMNEFDLVGNIVFLEGRDRSIFDPFNDEPILTKKPFSWGKLIVGVVAGLIVVAGVSLAVFSLGTSLGFAGLALNALTFAIAKKGTQYVLGQAITDIRNQENSSDGIYAREAIIGCIVGGISYGTSKIPGGGIGVTLLEESASEFVHQSFRNVKYDEDKGWIAGYYIDYDKEEFLANVAISVVVGEVTDKALDKLNPFRDYFDTYIQNASSSSTNEITRMVSDNFKEIFKTGIETGIMLAYTDLNNTENISQKTQDTIKEAEDFTKETYIFVKTIIEKIQKIDYDKAFNNIGESAQEIAEKLQEIAEKLQDIDLLEVVENIQNMNPEEIKNLFENMNPERLKKLFKNAKKEDKLIEETENISEGEKEIFNNKENLLEN